MVWVLGTFGELQSLHPEETPDVSSCGSTPDLTSDCKDVGRKLLGLCPRSLDAGFRSANGKQTT